LPAVIESDGKGFDLALGFRRLGILDLSSRGHQPMCTADKAIWVVHNGEIYNYVELRSELSALGHAFSTRTDTEVILAAYREWGESCVARFNGMWAFAIWDMGQRKLFCSRDHFGIKPFQFWHDSGTFAFASEAKALLATPGIPAKPNWPIIGDFLVHGLVDHTDQTCFDGIMNLPPGHSMVIGAADKPPFRYWQISANTNQSGPVGLREVDEFRSLLSDAVRIRLRSDVQIGTCLSGGLDSTSIAVLISRVKGDEGAQFAGAAQKTYSACYQDARCDERSFIEEVVAATSAHATYVYPDSAGLFEDLSNLVWHQELPFQSTSPYAQYCVMKAARRDGTVVLLDGQGSDEILAGYVKYWSEFSAALLQAGQWRRWLPEMRAYPARPPLSLFPALRATMASLLPPRATNAWRAFFRRSGTSMLVSRDLVRMARPNRGEVRCDLGDALSSALHAALFSDLQPLLRYEDRNSMAFSIESRLPFLDPRLVSYVFSLPLAARVEDGWTKAILRRAMAGLLPERVRLRRDKMGFPTPEATWLRADDGEFLRTLLDESSVRRRGLFRWAELSRLVASAVDPTHNERIPELWRCASVELWLRRFVDSSSGAGAST